MARRILAPLILFCLMCTGALFGADWVPLTSSTPQPPRVTVVSDAPGDTVLRVEVPGYTVEEVSVDGVAHSRVLLPKSPRLLNQGDPELPFVVASVAIPYEGTPRVEVLEEDTRTLRVGRYMPSKGSLSRSVDPETVPYSFSPVYSNDASYPAQAAAAGEPYLLRNVRGTAVAVYPIRFNPARGELAVSLSLTVRVRTTGSGGANVLHGSVPDCLDSEQVYANHFANGENAGRSYTPVRETGALLVVTNDAFTEAMLPLVYWKRQKGIPTEIVKLSEVGTTDAAVKALIQDRYDRGGLAYVLLVGDSGFMPYPLGTVGDVAGEAADPMYALLAGSDSYPDIVVSRFPAQTASEAATMANRVIRYEKTPQASASWYQMASGIASAEGAPTDGQRMDWLRADLLNCGYTAVDQIYDPGATAAQVTSALNSGRGLVNYIGHGGETYWVTSGFNVANVYALSNTDLVPFIFDVACVNGMFNRSGGDCFAEAWLKAGTPAAPKGALGIYAASTNQDWVPPCDAQGESVDLLAAGRAHTFGALCFDGVMKGLDMYPGATGQQLFQQWHIFGDGSEMVFTKPPTPMSVSHASVLPAGATSFAVTVSGVSGALCALYDADSKTLIGSAITGANGGATISLDAPPPGTSELSLTVTAFNRVPYIAAIRSACTLSCDATAPVVGKVLFPVIFSAFTSPWVCSGSPSFRWDFGDGSQSLNQESSHIYAEAGTYTWMMVASAAEVRCSSMGSIVILGRPPGDSDGDGAVSIGEVQLAINMFLEFLPPANGVDCDGDGAVSIGELQKVINAFLGEAQECS